MNEELLDDDDQRAIYEVAARMNCGTFTRMVGNSPLGTPIIAYRCDHCGLEHQCEVHLVTIPLPDPQPIKLDVSPEVAETRQTPVGDAFASILESANVKAFLEDV